MGEVGRNGVSVGRAREPMREVGARQEIQSRIKEHQSRWYTVTQPFIVKTSKAHKA
jgi:hypothetical protein